MNMMRWGWRIASKPCNFNWTWLLAGSLLLASCAQTPPILATWHGYPVLSAQPLSIYLGGQAMVCRPPQDDKALRTALGAACLREGGTEAICDTEAQVSPQGQPTGLNGHPGVP